MENVARFHDLVSLWVVRITCDAIGGVMQNLAVDEKKELTESQRSLVCAITETSFK